MCALLGALIGLLYSVIGFGAEGEAPRFSITFGPLHNGTLVLFNRHVHHWVVYLFIVLPTATICGHYNTASFAVIMAMHGLTYRDRFLFQEWCKV